MDLRRRLPQASEHGLAAAPSTPRAGCGSTRFRSAEATSLPGPRLRTAAPAAPEPRRGRAPFDELQPDARAAAGLVRFPAPVCRRRVARAAHPAEHDPG